MDRGDEKACLSLLTDIRWACGDNGKRMQAELVDHIADISKKVSERDELQRQVLALREALDQSVTSMLDSGYRTNSVVILAARQALDNTAREQVS